MLIISQVPWAHTYSRWYHQFPQFPLKALATAALLSEYTLTDLSTWVTSPDSVKSGLEIYKRGLDDDPNDPLLHAAHALYGARGPPAHAAIAEAFLDWLVARDGGQKVFRTFSISGQAVVTEAP
jgi:ABC-type tungstate transport system permease subunit